MLVAWKQANNEEIIADIIGLIGSIAIGAELLSREERVKRAMGKVEKKSQL